MAKKKKGSKSSRAKSGKSKGSLVGRINMAQRNFVLFLVFFIVFFLAYNFSTNLLFENFFGVLSVISGALTLVFLVSLIVLFILDGGRKRRR